MPDAGQILLHEWTVDVGATKMLLGRQTGGRLRVCAQIQTPPEPTALIPWLRGHLPGLVTSLGMAFAGGIGTDGRVSGWPNRPKWSGFPLRAALSQVADAVTVVDDGVAAALGESQLGVGQEHPDLLVAVFGTGLGGAVVVDRQVRLATAGDPRTLGHLRIFGGGACACGASGCAQLALRTLPPEDQLGEALAGWPEGLRLIGFLADLARFLGIGSAVLTGGLLQRPVLREHLTIQLASAGIETLVPTNPSASSLLGACVRGGAA